MRDVIAINRKEVLFGLLVAGVAFIVYANTLLNGFVWDDMPVIVYKQALRGDVLPLYAIPDKVLNTDPSTYYRPLTYTTFLLEIRLHGLKPLFMHLDNVILHAANTFLVFLVALLLLDSPYAACVAGLLFAVHPVNSEAVNFISARNTMLAGFFALLSFLLHKWSVLRDKLSGALIGAVAFLAGMLSKESALPVLLFIAALELPTIRSRQTRTRAIVRLLPYAAGLAVYLVMRDNALSHVTIPPLELSGIASRLLNNIYIIPRYFLIFIWPVSLNIHYRLPEDFNILALPLVAGWGVIFGLLSWILTRKDRRVSMFGLAWAAVFLLPVSGIIPFQSDPMAERFLYIPAIGLWLIVAERAAWVLSSSPSVMRRGLAAAAVLILALASLTVARNGVWRDNLTLFSQYVEQNPEDAGGHNSLGAAYFAAGDIDGAERQFRLALEMDPSLRALYNPLGTILLQKGDLEEALQYLSMALDALPVDQDARIKRAGIYEKLGRQKEALRDYEIALSIPGEYGGSGLRAYLEERVRELSR